MPELECWFREVEPLQPSQRRRQTFLKSSAVSSRPAHCASTACSTCLCKSSFTGTVKRQGDVESRTKMMSHEAPIVLLWVMMLNARFVVVSTVNHSSRVSDTFVNAYGHSGSPACECKHCYGHQQTAYVETQSMLGLQKTGALVNLAVQTANPAIDELLSPAVTPTRPMSCFPDTGSLDLHRFLLPLPHRLPRSQNQRSSANRL